MELWTYVKLWTLWTSRGYVFMTQLSLIYKVVFLCEKKRLKIEERSPLPWFPKLPNTLLVMKGHPLR